MRKPFQSSVTNRALPSMLRTNILKPTTIIVVTKGDARGDNKFGTQYPKVTLNSIKHGERDG